MGAFDAKREDIITIRNEKNWEPHESCTARTIVRSGDEEWVLNQQMLIQMPKGNRKQRRLGGFRKEESEEVKFKSQVGAARRLWVQKMLESWTFTANGQPIEFRRSGQNEKDDQYMSRVMQQLDSAYIDFIYEAIMDAQPKEAKQDEEEDDDDEEDDDEGSPFFANASPSTVGETFKRERTNQALMNGLPNTETTSHRNFLARS